MDRDGSEPGERKQVQADENLAAQEPVPPDDRGECPAAIGPRGPWIVAVGLRPRDNQLGSPSEFINYTNLHHVSRSSRIRRSRFSFSLLASSSLLRLPRAS